ncbi:MAG: cbb3-type cytochrome c oxidase subunit II [Acidimicrobiia bacterium]|nr:cbb3-type cytochrome c oxidase subunit II [Acidimicrobiia bacterium]
MSEFLAAAAQKLGAPEELVERSARARAAAQGVDPDAILAAWAGSEAAPAPATPPPAAAKAPAEEAAVEPTPEAAAPISAPAPAPAASAPAAVSVAVAARADAAPVVDARRQSGSGLLVGIGALLLFGALVSFVIPSVEGGDERHVVGVPALESLAEDGREVYVQQGCWYCHTQQVRPVVGDVGLGPATQRGSESLDAPAVLGLQRIGPDLTLYSYREGVSQDAVIEYLKHPQTAVEGSYHPSFGFLSDEDLAAVAAYSVADKVNIPREEES